MILGTFKFITPYLFLFLKVFLKKFKIFFSLLQINNFLIFSYHFNILILKIIFKK